MPKSANDFIVRPVWSVLSKGKTGTGKTIFSCGKAFRPTYVFNLEGRFESVINYYNKLDGHCKDVYYDDYSIESGFHPLDSQMDSIVKERKYQTVVVASLTSYIHIVLKHLIGATLPKSQRKKGGIQANILEDFNFEDAAIIYELISFLQVLKASGTNVILECHLTPYELVSLEDGQRVVTTINQVLTKGKKAPAQIPGYFNEVWLFDKFFPGWDKPAEYKINTIGTSLDECKTSFGINSFDWTNKDGSELACAQLTSEIRLTEREDPDKPKVVGW